MVLSSQYLWTKRTSPLLEVAFLVAKQVTFAYEGLAATVRARKRYSSNGSCRVVLGPLETRYAVYMLLMETFNTVVKIVAVLAIKRISMKP
jgi:hypothetical protein